MTKVTTSNQLAYIVCPEGEKKLSLPKHLFLGKLFTCVMGELTIEVQNSFLEQAMPDLFSDMSPSTASLSLLEPVLLLAVSWLFPVSSYCVALQLLEISSSYLAYTLNNKEIHRSVNTLKYSPFFLIIAYTE